MQRVIKSSTRAGVSLKRQSFTLARSIYSTTQLQSNSDKEASSVISSNEQKQPASSEPKHHKPRETVKTVAQEDEELRRRLEEMSGEGGAAGIEYEDGKPQTMKRSVRNNMFRYI
ncbi:uncharacterized protein BDV17DRAFT_185647 [Aspergillus undulatus]|uniref:uncharacterized protein n=1 Tax=Aspergillus undulatus TaxID=1810928 RepID=UPI003CCD8A9F